MNPPAPAAAPHNRIPRVLSIAGSDSGGGAGIQADLKAFAAGGVHGMTAITAITAQNTIGVTAVHAVPPEMILAQVRAVAQDIGVDAVKIGMLGDIATIVTVAQALDELPPGTPVVLDPVMLAESGAVLLASEAVAVLTAELLPRATVITPNVAEARALTGAPGAAVPELAHALRELGARAVIITGGHREEAIDVLLAQDGLHEIRGDTHPRSGHGSGCTHSSLLAARLAWGDDLLSAAREAKARTAVAVRDGLDEIGAGTGPVNVLGLADARHGRSAL